MVKTGHERAEKFALKNDAYVLMLRNKHLHFSLINHFKELTFRQYSLDSIINTVINTQGLVWGQRGRYHDLTEKLFWKGEDDLSEWLSQGIPEAAYNQTKSLIADMQKLFYICVYPRPKLLMQLSVSPETFYLPLSNRKDWLKETTFLSEDEKTPVPVQPYLISMLNVEVCAHNIVNQNAPFLLSPSLSFLISGVNPLLASPTVAEFLTQNLSPSLLRALSYTCTQIYAVLPNPVKANPNLYNLSPALNSEVVKTP